MRAVKNPIARAKIINKLRENGVDRDSLEAIRRVLTPEVILPLRDHACRGHKSGTRIQQLRHETHFKVRPRVSR